MNILFVSPYPPSRIRVRGYGFVQHLRRNHSVTILTQVASQQEWEDVAMLRAQGYEVIPVAAAKGQALIRSGLALFSAYPLQGAYARSPLFLHAVRKLCNERHFDVIHVEHLRGIASMESLIGEYPLVWDAVDCISQLWKQTALRGTSVALRCLASIEVGRTERYERQLVNKNAHIITVSKIDGQAMNALSLPVLQECSQVEDAKITVIPNGVELEYFYPTGQEYRQYNIAFSGKMSYHANVAAASYLYREIMPRIWQEQPAATLTIVGSKPPKFMQQWALDPRVEVTGYVDDMRPYIRRAHLMMSPMVYSVGLQNKVLEAMALGTPTVISPQSAAALEVQGGYDTLIAHSAEEFAACALHLMHNKTLRDALSVRGRRYVEQKHNWQVITEQLVHVYRRTITGETANHHSPIPEVFTTTSIKKKFPV